MEYTLRGMMVCISLLSLRIFGCSFVHFSLRGNSTFLNNWGGVFLDGVLLSWKTKKQGKWHKRMKPGTEVE